MSCQYDNLLTTNKRISRCECSELCRWNSKRSEKTHIFKWTSEYYLFLVVSLCVMVLNSNQKIMFWNIMTTIKWTPWFNVPIHRRLELLSAGLLIFCAFFLIPISICVFFYTLVIAISIRKQNKKKRIHFQYFSPWIQ